MNLDSAESKPEASEKHFFRASAEDFEQIPGSPIAYWVSEALRKNFSENLALSPVASPCVGLQTGDNARFLRLWHEVSHQRIGFHYQDRKAAQESGRRWFPYNKGGDFRRWYGNQEYVVDWQEDGSAIRRFVDANGKLRSRPQNMATYFQPSVSWSKISSGLPAFRFFPDGFIYDVAGTSIFAEDSTLRLKVLAYCNSKVSRKFLSVLSPTLNFEVGHIASLPLNPAAGNAVQAQRLIQLSMLDWDASEASWDFTALALLSGDIDGQKLERVYQSLRAQWHEMALDMQRIEEENNQIFIEAYGLKRELSPEVPLSEITLTCNPHYRYGGDRSEEELEALLLADTMREFISYAVGCMFGRYSLDKPGLVLANQGETVEDYLKQVPEPTFTPDADNVIPFLDGNWFADDVTERFKEFLRVTFGAEHYEENLRFIEDALNVRGRRSYSIRDFFLNEFYDDHVRRYKKRPIYWMFSSPKGSFRALIYMHRYRPDTVSVVLNNYLREFRTKLVAQRDQLEAVSASTGSSPAEKTRALRDLDRLSKVISELEDYEHDVLYPLAAQQVEIDLDDGVKANYPKLGAALRKIPGL